MEPAAVFADPCWRSTSFKITAALLRPAIPCGSQKTVDSRGAKDFRLKLVSIEAR
jgi:hypothetical protein